MTTTPEDHRAIACNYAEPVGVAAEGALCYVRWPNPGGGNDRMQLLVRSRGGRWIEKWEAISRLQNFRLKTIPPDHPLYDRLIVLGLQTIAEQAKSPKGTAELGKDANP